VDRGEHAIRRIKAPGTGGPIAGWCPAGFVIDTVPTGTANPRSNLQAGLHCANCGLAIDWTPVRVDRNAYCCGGCALGGPCYCSYDSNDRLGEGESPTLDGPDGDGAGR
jgi:hypothetical protein